jgi:RNA polymerase primary sigma factor
VIKFYFWIDQPYAYTLEEIGEKFDLTRERVRQIKEKGLRRLKHITRSKHLKQFLGQ